MTTEIIGFHETMLACQKEQDVIWVAVKPICEAIGVDSQTQYNQIKKHPILNRAHSLRYIHDSANRRQEMLCLRLDYIYQDGFLKLTLNGQNRKCSLF